MYKAKHQLLFCPGPVNIDLNVKQAAFDNEIGHREKEFSTLLRSINRKLLKLYCVDEKEYHSVVITGSGTAANETILSSIGEKKILIVTNGEFGERLFDISSIHNKNTSILRFGWAEKINIKYIEKYLKTKDTEAIAMVHHETSTGMLNPIKEIGKLAKKYKKMFIVDSVSSAGADEINLAKCNVTFCSGSAGKALGAFPGLSYVVGRKKDFASLEKIPARTAYLNLYKFYFYSKEYSQTPNTPSVPSFFALDQALSNILDNGLQNSLKHLKETSRMLRKNMKRLGFEFLINQKNMSSMLTTVLLPKHINVVAMKKMLKDKNIIIYNGKGSLKDRVFQVGNIGSISEEYLQYFLQSLEEITSTLRNDYIKRPFSRRHHRPISLYKRPHAI